MTTNVIGSGNGSFSCPGGGEVIGPDGHGMGESFLWSGTLEVYPSCVNGAYSCFKINGSWHNPYDGFHSCGSPYFALNSFTITCGSKPNSTPATARNPNGLVFCKSGKITGFEGNGNAVTIPFSGVASLVTTCNNASYSGVTINGRDYGAGYGYRDCGTTNFAINSAAIACDEDECVDCCKALLPIAAALTITGN